MKITDILSRPYGNIQFATDPSGSRVSVAIRLPAGLEFANGTDFRLAHLAPGTLVTGSEIDRIIERATCDVRQVDDFMVVEVQA